jgi:flagellar motor protein MotB
MSRPYSMSSNYRRRSADVDTEGSWALSYGDMVTLLLMFFMIFFSVDPVRERYQGLQLALLEELNLDKSKIGAPTDVFRMGPGDGQGVDKLLMKDWGGEATAMGSKILIDFPDTSFFDLGQITLTAESRKQLQAFAKKFEPYAGNYLLAIRAFTDSVPVRGSGGRYSDNLELSALRSIAALRELQINGIPLKRMRAEGYGEIRISPEMENALMKASATRNEKGISRARKVILIIEPDVEDRL